MQQIASTAKPAEKRSQGEAVDRRNRISANSVRSGGYMPVASEMEMPRVEMRKHSEKRKCAERKANTEEKIMEELKTIFAN